MEKNVYEFSVEELRALHEIQRAYEECISLFKSVDVDEFIRWALTPSKLGRMGLQIKALFWGMTASPTLKSLDDERLSSSTVRRILKTEIEAGFLEKKVKPLEKPPKVGQLFFRNLPKEPKMTKMKKMIIEKKGRWKRSRGRPEHVFVTQPWFDEFSRTGDITKAGPWSKDTKKFICKTHLYLIDCGIWKEWVMSCIDFITKFFRSERAPEFCKSFYLELENIDPKLNGMLWSDEINSQYLKELADRLEKNINSEIVELKMIALKSKLRESLSALNQ